MSVINEYLRHVDVSRRAELERIRRVVKETVPLPENLLKEIINLRLKEIAAAK